MGRGTCAIVICHGLSEYKLVSTIKSKLRLNIEIFAREKGRTSIQIDGLPEIFNNGVFRNVKTLTRRYDNINSHKKNLIDCRIFTIMDVDDCRDVSIRNNYLNGNVSGLGRHELKEFITPIYFRENLEDVLNDIKFPFVAKNNRDKHQYVKVFGPESNLLADEQSITDLCIKMKKSERTNFDSFIEYCFNHTLRF
ncbi:hypothetical protein EGT49_08120 [Companilactobacillus suantsaicola]|uniref:Uncharacterized protein n=1 Tax=Companilactobacillus suantsaicola TaxID=2487723 RepID=A0A4Z0JIR2_9LACO|nr:hypothetical protein [Companilactobacillus suantsaicola]TGD22737.1 hypothetical protein EGT49_08120 [Companilactobacillus suantsaicola]